MYFKKLIIITYINILLVIISFFPLFLSLLAAAYVAQV